MNFKRLAEKYKYLAFIIKSKYELKILLNDIEEEIKNDKSNDFFNNKIYYMKNFHKFTNYVFCKFYREYSPELKKHVYGFYVVNSKDNDWFSQEYTIIDYSKNIRKEKLKYLNQLFK